jgi:hypothetical protein
VTTELQELRRPGVKEVILAASSNRAASNDPDYLLIS